MNARSALRFRLLLAVFGFFVSATAAIAVILWNDPPFDIVVLGAGCAVLAVVACINIFVILVRLRVSKSTK